MKKYKKKGKKKCVYMCVCVCVCVGFIYFIHPAERKKWKAQINCNTDSLARIHLFKFHVFVYVNTIHTLLYYYYSWILQVFLNTNETHENKI